MKKITIAVLIAFILLVIFVVYIDKIKKGKEEKIQIFGKLKQEEIIKFELNNIEKNESVICEKNKDGVWEIINPKTCKTEENTVKAVLSELVNIDVDRKVIDKAVDLKQYGLEQPKFQIKFNLINNAAYSLIVGDKSPAENSYYIKDTDKNPVYTAYSYSIDNLKKTVKDLRKKEIFEFSTDKVMKIAVQYNGKVKEFVKKDKEKWNIAVPVKADAKSEEVISLIITVRNIRALDFIEDDPKSLQECGLLNAPNSIKMWLENEKEPCVLYIGNKSKVSNNVYAKTSLNPCIYEINPEVLRDINKDIKEFKFAEARKEEKKDSAQIDADETEIKDKKDSGE